MSESFFKEFVVTSFIPTSFLIKEVGIKEVTTRAVAGQTLRIKEVKKCEKEVK
jgi:hypothetical protein